MLGGVLSTTPFARSIFPVQGGRKIKGRDMGEIPTGTRKSEKRRIHMATEK